MQKKFKLLPMDQLTMEHGWVLLYLIVNEKPKWRIARRIIVKGVDKLQAQDGLLFFGHAAVGFLPFDMFADV